ncbi:MAG: DNA polymerase III subunit beta [Deltaproteobacteria bacterium]|nr:MAG: DNA polymerase III subunit beta [Deltaproteobacteria bacterium]
MSVRKPVENRASFRVDHPGTGCYTGHTHRNRSFSPGSFPNDLLRVATLPTSSQDLRLRRASLVPDIVEKKSTMPILASALLEATQGEGGGRLRVSAFDLEIGVTGTHPAEVNRTGSVALKHKELYDIVRMLPEKSCVLRREANNRVKITSGAAEFNIVGQPAEDYPPFPRTEKVQFVTVEPQQLLEMIEKTQFAISADETRHNLNGVYFEVTQGNVRMVATDGHRLSLIERPAPGNFNLKKGVIVPRKGLLELKRLLDEDHEGPCELGFTETSGVFQRGDLQMVMRLIDGIFPDYMQVIPKEADRTLTVDRPRLLDTLRRMSILSSDRTTNAVKFELGKDTLKVILTAVDAPQMDVELCDELSPGVLKPTGQAAGVASRYTAVIMPMRI